MAVTRVLLVSVCAREGAVWSMSPLTHQSCGGLFAVICPCRSTAWGGGTVRESPDLHAAPSLFFTVPSGLGTDNRHPP